VPSLVTLVKIVPRAILHLLSKEIRFRGSCLVILKLWTDRMRLAMLCTPMQCVVRVRLLFLQPPGPLQAGLFLQFLFDFLHIGFDPFADKLAHLRFLVDTSQLEPLVEFVVHLHLKYSHEVFLALRHYHCKEIHLVIFSH
jgi:hypothetical protein